LRSVGRGSRRNFEQGIQDNGCSLRSVFAHGELIETKDVDGLISDALDEVTCQSVSSCVFLWLPLLVSACLFLPAYLRLPMSTSIGLLLYTSYSAPRPPASRHAPLSAFLSASVPRLSVYFSTLVCFRFLLFFTPSHLQESSTFSRMIHERWAGMSHEERARLLASGGVMMSRAVPLRNNYFLLPPYDL
jgi:hypothetical protein